LASVCTLRSLVPVCVSIRRCSRAVQSLRVCPSRVHVCVKGCVLSSCGWLHASSLLNAARARPCVLGHATGRLVHSSFGGAFLVVRVGQPPPPHNDDDDNDNNRSSQDPVCRGHGSGRQRPDLRPVLSTSRLIRCVSSCVSVVCLCYHVLRASRCRCFHHPVTLRKRAVPSDRRQATGRLGCICRCRQRRSLVVAVVVAVVVVVTAWPRRRRRRCCHCVASAARGAA
jgi:hypothetical protein